MLVNSKRITRLFAFACVAGIAASACSSSHKTVANAPTSSSGTSSSNTTGASGSATAGASASPTGTPIAIGTTEDETGSPGQTGKTTTAVDLMQVWAKWTNAHGGLNGHPVRVVALNDNSDPAQAQSDLTTLVNNDNVVAIVGQDSAATLATWKSFIDSNHVPVIGGESYDLAWYQDGLFYPTSTTVGSNIYGQPFAAKNAGASKYASLVCDTSPSCQTDLPLIKADVAQLGMQLVFNETASPTAADYTAQCIAMKNAGANAINVAVNDLVLYRDCIRQNYRPLIITTNYVTTPAQIHENPDILAGLVGPSPTFPPFQEFPATASYFDALRAYAPQYLPGGSAYTNTYIQPATSAWVAAEAFGKAVENANVPAGTPVTRADVMRGLSMFHGETLGGMAPSLTYGDGTTPNPQVKCFFLYKTANSTVGFATIPPNSLQTYCQP